MRELFVALALFALLFNFQYSTGLDIPSENDVALITSRRIQNLIEDNTLKQEEIDKWRTSFTSSSQWPDIQVSGGCDVRKANWPAIDYLVRLVYLSVAFNQNSTNANLLPIIQSGLNYWFENDYTEPDCLDSGGISESNCPCGTPGLWNKNWFDQLIGTPKYIGRICLLIRDYLTPDQMTKCIEIQWRTYSKIDSSIRQVKEFTGSNFLNIANVGISLSLLKKDRKLLKDALERFYKDISIADKVAKDGIQPDGSFLQHKGILYSGNYGVSYMEDLISVFIETRGTSVGPTESVQEVFNTFLDGTEWLIINDAKISKKLWQYSVIGRMVSFRYADNQASSGVHLKIEKVSTGAEGWKNKQKIYEITSRLLKNDSKNANQGGLVGTRYFYNSDYMVHRTPSYVIAMKTQSNRTLNSECINNQNPYGFHLSDGAIYNYLSGDEYLDVFGSYNWEHIPGTTVDVQGTELKCTTVRTKPKMNFVGGTTDGNTGVAVMDFVNSRNKNLAFRKVAFFFPNVYAIQLSRTISKNVTSELVTVLDQRRRNGDIYINGILRNTNSSYITNDDTRSIWHDRIGYYFLNNETVGVDSKPRASNWSDIGISIGTEENQLFDSYIKHKVRHTTGLLTQYIVQPNVNAADFNFNLGKGKLPIALDFRSTGPQINAAFSSIDETIAVVFWTSGTYVAPWGVTIKVSKPCALLLRKTNRDIYRITISDPSHYATSIDVDITINKKTKTSKFVLPQGVFAGKNVVRTYKFK